MCVNQEEKFEAWKGRGWEPLGVPRADPPPKRTFMGRGKDSRLEVCGQYNKLKLSQNKHPSPIEDEGVLRNQTPGSSRPVRSGAVQSQEPSGSVAE